MSSYLLQLLNNSLIARFLLSDAERILMPFMVKDFIISMHNLAVERCEPAYGMGSSRNASEPSKEQIHQYFGM